MTTKNSISSLNRSLESSLHEDYIYQRLGDISKKILHEPPQQFHPSSLSPRHLEKSISKINIPSMTMTKSSLQMHEVKDLSELVQTLQNNLRDLQNEYIRVLMKADNELKEKEQIELQLQECLNELANTRSIIQENQVTIHLFQNEVQQLQIKNDQREKHLFNVNTENESYLQKIILLQSQLKESDNILKNNDTRRSDTLNEMKQQINQFKVDLEYATIQISSLTAQKLQAETEAINSQNRYNSIKTELESLNNSFALTLQNFQKTTNILNQKIENENQMLSRIELLEEECKSKSISLQRSILNSTESDRIIEELNIKYSECNQELNSNREIITEYVTKLKNLEKEIQLKELEITNLQTENNQIKELQLKINDLENKNKDFEMLQSEAEKTIEQLTATIVEKTQQTREIESKYEIIQIKLSELESTNNNSIIALESLQSTQINNTNLTEEINKLKESSNEYKQKYETELSEKETLTSRITYLEEMLENLSQNNMNLSNDKIRNVENEVSKYQKENEYLKKELEINIEKLNLLQQQQSQSQQEQQGEQKQLIRQESTHPVYDIFGLPENFDQSPAITSSNIPSSIETKISPQLSLSSNSPNIDVTKSSLSTNNNNNNVNDSNTHLPITSDNISKVNQQSIINDSHTSKTISKDKNSSNLSDNSTDNNKSTNLSNNTSNENPSRKLDSKYSMMSVNDEPIETQSSSSPVPSITNKKSSKEDNNESSMERNNSTVSVSSQKSTSHLRSSGSFISSNSSDPQYVKLYRKKVIAEIANIKKERQDLKKEIVAWNEKFEKENGHEASRDEKINLAGELYDKYQDLTNNLRKYETKLERVEEKYKSLIEKNQSKKALNSEESQNPIAE